MSAVANTSTTEVENAIVIDESKEVKEGAEKVEKATTGAVQQKQVAPLNLKKITIKELKKKDSALVKKHVPKHSKDIRWDETRNVAVILKSGKTRAYKIGAGAAPALKESKNKDDVKAFLKGLKG